MIPPFAFRIDHPCAYQVMDVAWLVVQKRAQVVAGLAEEVRIYQVAATLLVLSQSVQTEPAKVCSLETLFA